MNAKPLVFTYTNMHCYEDVCPMQFFRKYVKKDLPFVETEAMRFGNQVHTAFEHRVGGGKPLPSNMRQWEPFAAPLDGTGAKVEMKLGITIEAKPTGFFDRDVFMRGKADVVMIQNTTAFIVDWKTGNSRYEDPFELELHAIMLKAANPYLNTVKGAYAWLKDDKMSRTYDLSDFNSTWARACNTAEQIRDDMQSGEWEKRQGPLCGWCDVLDCEFNRKGK